MAIEVETYVLPTCVASALVNRDYSGLSDEDQKELDDWFDKVNPGHCVGVSEEEWFQHGHDMNCNQGATVCKYFFHTR